MTPSEKSPIEYHAYGEMRWLDGFNRGKDVSSDVSGINTALTFVAGLFFGQLVSREAMTVVVICILVFTTVVACVLVLKEARK